MNTLIDTTARSFVCQQNLLFDQTCYTIVSDFSPIKLCAAMNSTLAQLIINLSGRANFGGGLLRIATYELANLQIVNPELLLEPDTAIFNSTDWDTLSPSAERWEIDGMVFDALGLTAGERAAVYEGVMELVGNRKQKAGNAPLASLAAGHKGPYADAFAQSVVVRGKAIYGEKVRPHVAEETDRGKYVVVDVFSEDYEIDPSNSAGTWRLLDRRPGAVTFKLRIDYPSVYKMDRPRKRVQ